MKKVYKIIVRVFLFITIFWLGAFLATENQVVKRMAEKGNLHIGRLAGKYSRSPEGWGQNIDFGLYWDLWDTIKELYVDQESLNDKEMFYGSLKGLVSSLDDPYSEFMDPLENQIFLDEVSGSFEGIGAEVGIRDNLLTVISPLDGNPAQKAGIMAGDRIIEIDGESSQGMTLNEAVSRIKGPKGSEVVLNIFRDGFEDLKEFKIVRDIINIESISYEVLDDNIFLINISSFNGDTDYLFRQIARDISERNPKGLIIDLRNNPGGYLEVAIEILGEWINDQVAVIEEFSNGDREEYLAQGFNLLRACPTVVLLNYGSASASEILAGALQDYELATIIGERSYGKGSVQMVKNLKDGSSLKLTNSKWLTPKGTSIDKEGIKPDQEVVLSFEDWENNRDPQLEAAINFLLK